ncbi:MAG: DUF3536 domain-containing protein [Elusimicrobia bacterium]|nr:DUF3536 domain-containing protein [Elusimicrobiota bacterium]
MRNKSYHIHLHLDHPDSENPWTEEPDIDPAAEPFVDAAERCTHLSWGPLSSAERRGRDGRLQALENVWALVGFDAAPGLLARLERRAPKVFEAVTAGGRGAAAATAFPPLVLPLADAADRRAAVRWGLRDFRRRFGRPAAGFRPPGGAADDATLALLAREGLSFALLPAAAAARTRAPGSAWLESAPETLDCSRPYLWRSKDEPGLSLPVFFIPPGPDPEALFLSRPRLGGTAPVPGPEDPEEAGERLAAKLVDSLRVNDAAQLAHAAFDASFFGLRLPGGERTLARALSVLESEAPAGAASHADFLALFPPPQEVEVRCDAASRRTPLRTALESLSLGLSAAARAAWTGLVRDPDAAVDLAGDLAFDHSHAAQERFLGRVMARHPRPDDAVRALRLADLELWRLRSLGRWGFEDRDPSGPDAVQALRCAARALDGAARALGRAAAEPLEKSLTEALSGVPSRGTAFANAAAVYQRLVVPERLDAARLAAHLAAADHLFHGPDPAGPACAPPVWEAEVRPLLRRCMPDGRSWRSLSVLSVELRHRRTFEAWSGAAVVRQRGTADFEVRSAAVTPSERGPLAAKADAAFLAGTEDALRAALDASCGPASWSLDALLPAQRRAATRAFRERGTPERRGRLEAFAALSRRSGASPDAWAAALDALGGAAPPDSLPAAPLCRIAALRAAEAFALEPGPGTLAPLLTLLDAGRRAGLSFPLWELRARAWPALPRCADGAGTARLAALLGLPAPQPLPAGGTHGDQTP